MLIFIWFIASLIVGGIGSDREMGFWGVFLISLILSPLIGLIVAFAAAKKQAPANTNNIHYSPPPVSNQQSIGDELEKLKKQLDNGTLTQDEFQQLKNKLIAKFD